jgi:hypothetical protein
MLFGPEGAVRFRLVLPAWATVAIAVGGSLITAVASIGVAYLTKKQESVAEWRKLMVEVGEDFSTGVGNGHRPNCDGSTLLARGRRSQTSSPHSTSKASATSRSTIPTASSA